MSTMTDTEGSEGSAPAAEAPKAVSASKSAFIQGLPRDLGAKEAVAQAKQQGITITEAYVYKVRAAAKAGTKRAAAKRTGTKPSTPKAGIGLKAAFVRSLPPDLSFADAAAKAKEAGIVLSQAHFYAIKSQAKKGAPAAPKGKAGRKPMLKASPAPAPKGLRLSSADVREQALIDAVRALGVSRARSVIAIIEKYERVIAR